MHRQQQALQASVGEAEQAAAARRAQVLISQGYGPLQAWLSYSGRHEGERSVEAQEPSRPECLASPRYLFEAA